MIQVQNFHPSFQSQSDYNLLSIITLSTVLTALMIMIVVGNMLVIIAIATESNLSSIQEWGPPRHH